MVRLSLRFTAIILLGLLAACKKDIHTPKEKPPPQEIIETEPPVLKPVYGKVNEVVGGYYIVLPGHYNETQKAYPLLVFIHGAGQFGNGTTSLPNLLTEAIPELLDKKKFPPSFNFDGKNFSFIIAVPQFTRYPVTSEVKSFIDHAIKTYRVDSTRVYLTGFSIGGTITADVAADYTSLFAAIVPISGVSSSLSNVTEKCKRIANGKLPVWVFHNDGDSVIRASESKKFISLINSFNPAIPPKFTLFSSRDHDAWTVATDPAYKENNMNMYEWMLKYSR